MAYLGELAGLSCGLVWTLSSFIWAKYGGRLSAFSINSFKAVTGFVMISIVTTIWLGSAWPVDLTFRQQAILLGSGIIGLGIGDAFYFMALLRMGARRALLMWLVTPAMAAVLGMRFLGAEEEIGLLGWSGMVLTCLGILVVQLEAPGKDARTEVVVSRRVIFWGSMACLVACLGQAVSSLMTKMILNEAADPLQVVQVRLAGAMAFLVPGGLLLGRLRAWAGQYQGGRVLGWGLFATFLATALGLSLMTLSQKMIPIGLSNTLTSTSPLFALPMAWLFFRSPISLRAVFGTLVAFIGVAMVFAE